MVVDGHMAASALCQLEFIDEHLADFRRIHPRRYGCPVPRHHAFRQFLAFVEDCASCDDVCIGTCLVVVSADTPVDAVNVFLETLCAVYRPLCMLLWPVCSESEMDFHRMPFFDWILGSAVEPTEPKEGHFVVVIISQFARKRESCQE